APADDTDLPDALQGLGHQGEQVPPATHDGFLHAADLDDLLLEERGLEIQLLGHRSGSFQRLLRPLRRIARVAVVRNRYGTRIRPSGPRWPVLTTEIGRGSCREG